MSLHLKSVCGLTELTCWRHILLFNSHGELCAFIQADSDTLCVPCDLKLVVQSSSISALMRHYKIDKLHVYEIPPKIENIQFPKVYSFTHKAVCEGEGKDA